MNTADLHPKRFPLSLTVAELRKLGEELQAMEHAPHEGRISADKQIEHDRAGEQVLSHLQGLVSDTRDRDEGERIEDSVPLLRASAKHLLTACDRCRRRALLTAKALAGGAGDGGKGLDGALAEVRTFDGVMRQLAVQHGVDSPLRELVVPVALSQAELDRIGLRREDLFDSGELFARS